MSDDETSPREILLGQHRKEKKELQSQIQALKKTATKGDKKKKKEVADQIQKLEQDLQDKHKKELDELEASSPESATNGCTEIVNGESEAKPTEDDDEPALGPLGLRGEKEVRVSKAQKRREKKTCKEKERQREIEEQEEENKVGARHQEQEKIKHRLEANKLKIKEIPSDGDCMFAGILHQLQLLSLESSVTILRQDTVAELRARREEYLPFLSNQRTGEMLSEAEFEEYCEKMRGTPAWGGQVELRALSHVLEKPISVIQADGPPMVVGEEFSKNGNPLTLTYHRHAFGLGEHYNSVIPLGENS